MELATPKGTITWEARGFTSTIDLAFTSQLLQQRLVECTIYKALNYSFDHFPISLQFELRPTKTKIQLTKAQKKINFNLIATTTT